MLLPGLNMQGYLTLVETLKAILFIDKRFIFQLNFTSKCYATASYFYFHSHLMSRALSLSVSFYSSVFCNLCQCPYSFSETAVLPVSSVLFLFLFCLKCIDRNLKLIAPLWLCLCRCSLIVFRKTLCSISPFTVPSSIDLFLFLCKPLSSMSNPLWCSRVCWSCARVAWDYYGWRHHTHSP